jgi:Flp pilus assembly protein CpaB
VLRLRRYLPRIGRWPRLLLAGCCVLLALASAVNAKPAAEPLAHTAPVVVAASDLPAGHQLSRTDLTVEHWPPELRPAGARGDPSVLTGRRLAGPVGDGEPITDTRLIGADLTTGLSRLLVAAAVTLGDDHAVELVRPGNRVDLLEADRPVDPLAGAPRGTTEVADLATHVAVLAVLPATESSDAELVVAVDRPTAVRISRDSATHVFTAVVVPP